MEEKGSVSFSRPRYLRALVVLLLLALGAALLAKLAAVQSKPGGQIEKHAWQLVTSRVEAGQLMDIHPHGSGEVRPQAFDNPEDAALDHFKDRLQAGGGRFFPRKVRQPSGAHATPGPEIEVLNPEGAVVGRLKVELPRGDTVLAPGATLWALALPSRALYRIDTKGEIHSVVIPKPGSEFTVYALVTPANNSFVATKVQ